MTVGPNPITLPNVVFSHKLRDLGLPKEVLFPTYDIPGMRELLWELASKNPLWDFLISKSSVHKRDDGAIDGLTHVLFIREITIKSEREVLGSFAADYHGGTKKIYVTNERMAKGRSGRNSGRMVTSDPKRAYREIIKNFYAKNPKELVTDAIQTLSSKLGEVGRKISHAVYSFDNELETAAASFVKRNPEVLTAFSNADPDRDKAVFALTSWRNAKEDQDKMNALSMTANAMWFNLSDPSKHKAPDNAAVVISQGSTYVLTYKGQTCTVPSEDLPEELRGPLGMLKLSDAMQVIEGVGFKVDDRIFFVLAQESNDESAA
jgi:hypothetical protein